MNLLQSIYDTLLDHYGPQSWWPADTDLEMMVSAILVQNTNWLNVEKALLNLKPYATLSELQNLSLETFEDLIRPAGFYKAKARTIQDLLTLLASTDLTNLTTPELREMFLSLKGIGHETADCFLLYRYQRPVFVVDTYLKRLFKSFGLPSFKTYQGYQDYIHAHLDADTDVYQEFHALIVAYGKEFKTPSDLDPLHTLRHPYFPITHDDLKALSALHPKMASLIDHIGVIQRPVSPTPLHALLDAVIGQLISTKAAQAIAQRFNERFDDVYTIDETSTEALRAVGLSRAKAETIQTVMARIKSNDLDLEALQHQSDETITQALTQIKGIGAWTAQMVLIHGYKRPSVKSYGDAALRKGLMLLFNLESIDPATFNALMAQFHPYETLSSIYLWRLSAFK